MTTTHTIKTEAQARSAFWQQNWNLTSHYQPNKRQNDYPTDVRAAWCEWLDSQVNRGTISHALAMRATL